MLTSEQVEDIAYKYLADIGNLLGPGEPKFDDNKKIWIVSVFHSSSVAHFEMGEMTIDPEGNVITIKLLEDSPEIRKLEKYGYKEKQLNK